MIDILKWFKIGWWKYLLEPQKGWYNKTNRFIVFLCRAKGHPCGVWWYNTSALEPDMKCKNCGDDLG